MKILWFNWKDMKNPLAGGAEVVTEELIKKLAQDRHEVILLTAGFKDCVPQETVDNYKIIRLGNRFTVYYHAYKYYKKHLAGWPDLIIDEINTIPFFVKFYSQQKAILFIHQLARQIWFYQMPFPLSLIGYLLEPLYLRLLSHQSVITVSESSKKDLLKYGFKAKSIQIISEGIKLDPIEDLNKIQKYPHPTILALGAIRAMKRTHCIIKVFEIAKQNIPNLELIVAGDASDKYGQKVLKIIQKSKYRDSIQILPGFISPAQKIELMQKSHILCVTSVKEGWGLVVTEASSQGTPAIVYNVDGLRDSVRHHQTGLICEKNTPACLAQNIVELLKDQNKYSRLRQAGWEWSKEINFERSYQGLRRFLL